MEPYLLISYFKPVEISSLSIWLYNLTSVHKLYLGIACVHNMLFEFRPEASLSNLVLSMSKWLKSGAFGTLIVLA
jgi:hypothetical protein